MTARDDRGRFIGLADDSDGVAEVVDEVCASVTDAPRPAPPVGEQRRVRRLMRQRATRLVRVLPVTGSASAMHSSDEEAAA